MGFLNSPNKNNRIKHLGNDQEVEFQEIKSRGLYVFLDF